jgi:thiol-disulfide isomerase/thioredoxin
MVVLFKIIKIVTFGVIIGNNHQKKAMLKKLLFIVFIISLSARGQIYVKGNLTPANGHSWIALYQLKGTKQLYIKNTTITNGEFKIVFPADAAKGMYRLLYDLKNNGYVDFIYNNEDIELKFDPAFPFGTLEFIKSDENKIYSEYLKESIILQQKMDSLQLIFFRQKEANQKERLTELYQKAYRAKNTIQQQFEEKSEGKLANSFIRSSKKYSASNLIQSPQEYLNSEKQHYFDFIDFNDTELINSTFLSEKVTDYVLYLNVSDDVEVQEKLYKNAVNEVMEQIGKNQQIKSELLAALLYSFAQIEDIVLTDYLLANYYSELPEMYKNGPMIAEIESKLKLSIGRRAPDFSWEEKGNIKKLSELAYADNYILVFWSTTCSHCLKEIPKLYKLTKDNPAIHVIAVALEDDALGFNQHTLNFVKWTNILGLKKWRNPIARSYEIVLTPTYFVLDNTKKIISKPDFLVDVKAFFNKK